MASANWGRLLLAGATGLLQGRTKKNRYADLLAQQEKENAFKKQQMDNQNVEMNARIMKVTLAWQKQLDSKEQGKYKAASDQVSNATNVVKALGDLKGKNLPPEFLEKIAPALKTLGLKGLDLSKEDPSRVTEILGVYNHIMQSVISKKTGRVNKVLLGQQINMANQFFLQQDTPMEQVEGAEKSFFGNLKSANSAFPDEKALEEPKPELSPTKAHRRLSMIDQQIEKLKRGDMKISPEEAAQSPALAQLLQEGTKDPGAVKRAIETLEKERELVMQFIPPKELDDVTAERFFDEAGGDKDKARKLVEKAGYRF